MLARLVGWAVLGSLAVGAPAAAEAQTSPVQVCPPGAECFFGIDTGGTDNSPPPSLVASTTAEASFLARLQGVGTEGFDAIPPDEYPGGLTLNFAGAGGATLTSTQPLNIRTEQAGEAEAGRYPVPSSLPNFLEVTEGDLTITFGSPIAAFGFYGIDAGDFGSRLMLSFIRQGGSNTTLDVAHYVTNEGSLPANSSAFFFGFITDNPFDAVVFSINRELCAVGDCAPDLFAFDNLTIGSELQVKPLSGPEPGLPPTDVVPEPVSMLLLGTGLAGVGAMRRRRRQPEAA